MKVWLDVCCPREVFQKGAGSGGSEGSLFLQVSQEELRAAAGTGR